HHKLTCNRPVRNKTLLKNNRLYIFLPFPLVAVLRLILFPLCGLWIFGVLASTSSRTSLFGVESYITGSEEEQSFPTFFPSSQRLLPPSSHKSHNWLWGFRLTDNIKFKLATPVTNLDSFGFFNVGDMGASSNSSGPTKKESQEQSLHEQLLEQKHENIRQSVYRKSRHPPQQILNEVQTTADNGHGSPSYSIPSYFSLDLSTEENYGVENMDFYGPFASIRASLDYSYHGNYEKKRQEFQDHIVQKLLDGTIIEDSNGRVCRTPTEPYIVFTAGVMVRENRYVGLK
ncbi:hypothetical protein ACHAXS_000652, partial [Conticribra weissflogii]